MSHGFFPFAGFILIGSQLLVTGGTIVEDDFDDETLTGWESLGSSLGATHNLTEAGTTLTSEVVGTQGNLNTNRGFVSTGWSFTISDMSDLEGNPTTLTKSWTWEDTGPDYATVLGEAPSWFVLASNQRDPSIDTHCRLRKNQPHHGIGRKRSAPNLLAIPNVFYRVRSFQSFSPTRADYSEKRNIPSCSRFKISRLF